MIEYFLSIMGFGILLSIWFGKFGLLLGIPIGIIFVICYSKILKKILKMRKEKNE